MTYASLWSFSYFTFTLNQLLTPNTREYVYTKYGLYHRYSFHCQPWPWFDRTLRNGTTVNHGWPWLTMLLRNGYTTVMMTMVDHGHGDHSWPWLTALWEMAPRSTMVDHDHGDHGWPWSSHGFWLWCHFSKCSQPWLDHGQIPWFDHGQPWSNHGFLAEAIGRANLFMNRQSYRQIERTDQS